MTLCVSLLAATQQKTRPRRQPWAGSSVDAERLQVTVMMAVGLSVVNLFDKESLHDSADQVF